MENNLAFFRFRDIITNIAWVTYFDWMFLYVLSLHKSICFCRKGAIIANFSELKNIIDMFWALNLVSISGYFIGITFYYSIILIIFISINKLIFFCPISGSICRPILERVYRSCSMGLTGCILLLRIGSLHLNTDRVGKHHCFVYPLFFGLSFLHGDRSLLKVSWKIFPQCYFLQIV